MGAGTATKQRESQNRSNQKQSNQIKEVVKKRLGLKTTVPGPMDYLQDEKKTLAYNLKGKDRYFYGKEASKFTDDAMVDKNIVKVGNYFKKVGGEFVRISKTEGEKLYAAGDPSISRSVIGNSNANTIKYGSSNSAMGSGDPTGVMTSTPISKEMLERQNKIKGLSTAALSFAVPGVGGSVMRASAATDLVNASQPQLAYNDYMKSFSAKQSGKKFTSDRNMLGIMKLGLSKGKDKLGETFGN